MLNCRKDATRIEGVRSSDAIFSCLSEGFEHAKHQILLIDPLPLVEKAYSMLLNVESEMAIQLSASSGMDSSALLAKQQVVGFPGNIKQRTSLRWFVNIANGKATTGICALNSMAILIGIRILGNDDKH